MTEETEYIISLLSESSDDEPHDDDEFGPAISSRMLHDMDPILDEFGPAISSRMLHDMDPILDPIHVESPPAKTSEGSSDYASAAVAAAMQESKFQLIAEGSSDVGSAAMSAVSQESNHEVQLGRESEDVTSHVSPAAVVNVVSAPLRPYPVLASSSYREFRALQQRQSTKKYQQTSTFRVPPSPNRVSSSPM